MIMLPAQRPQLEVYGLHTGKVPDSVSESASASPALRSSPVVSPTSSYGHSILRTIGPGNPLIAAADCGTVTRAPPVYGAVQPQRSIGGVRLGLRAQNLPNRRKINVVAHRLKISGTDFDSCLSLAIVMGSPAEDAATPSAHWRSAIMSGPYCGRGIYIRGWPVGLSPSADEFVPRGHSLSAAAHCRCHCRVKCSSKSGLEFASRCDSASPVAAWWPAAPP